MIFFGAVLSAIMSCASATLLAPSVAFSENIVKGMVPGMSDRAFLQTMRTVLVCFTAVVLSFALSSDATIFKMVESAYKITLVSAFIPLFAGLYWPRARARSCPSDPVSRRGLLWSCLVTAPSGLRNWWDF